MATSDSRNRRIGTDEEFAAIAEYLRGHDFRQQTFTVNGRTYQLTGDGAISNDPFGGAGGTERNPWDTGDAIRSWGIVDADGTVIQRNDGRQVSDIGVSAQGKVAYGDGNSWRDSPLTTDGWEIGFGQADNKGQYRKFWQFAAIAGAGAAAGAASGGTGFGYGGVDAAVAGGMVPSGTAAAGTAAGSIAGITGADALRLALLAGAVGRSGGGGGSGAGGAAQTDVAAGIKPPEAPPAPSAGLGFDPIALFQQNRTRNQTDLNPSRVRPLVALGNTLLGA